MADTEQTTTAATSGKAISTAPAITEFPLALSEFCTRLSAKETRVELIGAFEHTERVAGRTSDLDSNYAGRFVAFATQPV